MPVAWLASHCSAAEEASFCGELKANVCPWTGRQSVLTAPFGVLQLARIVKSLQQMNAAAIKATTGKAPELPAGATDVPRAVPGSVLAAELAAQRADLEGRLAVCSSKLRESGCSCSC